ncbi:MAG: sialate O-acetylesterase [Ferruginibacter sp.]|nr:sialate O-acetylesterase [Ferruginibacter sp.]
MRIKYSFRVSTVCAFTLLVLLLSHKISFSQVSVASIFTDNMVLQQQSSVPVWGWSTPGALVRCTSSWDKKEITARAGSDGKWIAWLKTPVAGGPYEITLADKVTLKLSNVLIGEVWLCSGQSNMEMPMMGFKGQSVEGSNEAILRSANEQVRVYTVPRAPVTTPQPNSKNAAWKIAGPESISNFSATAYYFARLLNEILHVPVGVINASYGGSEIESWMPATALGSFPTVKIPSPADSIKVPNRTPTALYNGMIYPLIGYGLRGFTWYQGESNYDRPQQYAALFAAMINNWRRSWKKDDLPFYFAQIAPFNYALYSPKDLSPHLNSAYLREAQVAVADRVANTGMAVLLDAGNEQNIHPANKQVAGERLAFLALAKTYGLKGLGATSPAFDSLVIKDSVAIVQFKNAPNWLTSFDRPLLNFEIAGADKIFYPATAIIYRTTVHVTSPQVKSPVAVRYAFKNFVNASLFGTDALPASSFRTDNW